MPDRKIRTREHIIADLSTNHFERHALLCNFSSERMTSDYGYDLAMYTYKKNGEIENGNIYIQLKATDSLKIASKTKTITFTLDKRDLNLWLKEFHPVILVLYDAQKRKAYWIHIQRYFGQLKNFNLAKMKASKRVHLPMRNVITLSAILGFADYKRKLYDKLLN